jgi:hypothetical protein
MYIFNKTSFQYQLVRDLWKANRVDNANQIVIKGNEETQLMSRNGQLYWLITDYSNPSSTHRMSYKVPYDYRKVGSRLESIHAFSLPSESSYTEAEIIEALCSVRATKLRYELGRRECNHISLELNGSIHTDVSREIPEYLVNILTELLIEIPEQGWCVYQEDFEKSPWIRFGVGITKEDALLMFESREQTYYIGA